MANGTNTVIRKYRWRLRDFLKEAVVVVPLIIVGRLMIGHVHKMHSIGSVNLYAWLLYNWDLHDICKRFIHVGVTGWLETFWPCIKNFCNSKIYYWHRNTDQIWPNNKHVHENARKWEINQHTQFWWYSRCYGRRLFYRNSGTRWILDNYLKSVSYVSSSDEPEPAKCWSSVKKVFYQNNASAIF